MPETTKPGHRSAAARSSMFLGADPEFFHQYLQVNVQVTDDHGADVTDYMLEFSGPDFRRNDAPTVSFHREVLEGVHVNGANAALRYLFVTPPTFSVSSANASAGTSRRSSP